MILSGLGVKKDPERAIRILEKSAKEGNPFAHAFLGIHFRGDGKNEENADRAYSHLKFAADNFNAGAMLNLGVFHIMTSGKYQNKKRGVELLEAVARRGNLSAAFFLGRYYEEGHYLPKDEKKMTFWYCRFGAEGKHRLEAYFGHEVECE
ncbi:MAG: sel1 repeat family protein [Rhodospirillales bacterium]|jgi:uncharacterized protein|nr:sel1 repeat family protein [Rhodospirillales bacterium]